MSKKKVSCLAMVDMKYLHNFTWHLRERSRNRGIVLSCPAFKEYLEEEIPKKTGLSRPEAVLAFCPVGQHSNTEAKSTQGFMRMLEANEYKVVPVRHYSRNHHDLSAFIAYVAGIKAGKEESQLIVVSSLALVEVVREFTARSDGKAVLLFFRELETSSPPAQPGTTPIFSLSDNVEEFYTGVTASSNESPPAYGDLF
jgi:hypothetical protein